MLLFTLDDFCLLFHGGFESVFGLNLLPLSSSTELVIVFDVFIMCFGLFEFQQSLHLKLIVQFKSLKTPHLLHFFPCFPCSDPISLFVIWHLLTSFHVSSDHVVHRVDLFQGIAHLQINNLLQHWVLRHLSFLLKCFINIHKPGVVLGATFRAVARSRVELSVLQAFRPDDILLYLMMSAVHRPYVLRKLSAIH
jgi:hypothetical protein